MQSQGPRNNRQSDPFSQMLFGASRMNQTEQRHQVTQQPPQQHPQQHPPFQQQQRMQFQPQQQQYQEMHYQHPQQHGGQYQQPYQQQQGKKSFKMMNYFKKDDGTLDYEKIGTGFQQVTGIAGQVRPLVKQLSPLLAYFKK
ncbi:YppG family protein [Evansella sp. AB-rgal1]|uniref:YppG family protein n=1 Tax=Evansella sp. AB-rgal1 TaxID=3242696 RepID=UPI00359CE413